MSSHQHATCHNKQQPPCSSSQPTPARHKCHSQHTNHLACSCTRCMHTALQTQSTPTTILPFILSDTFVHTPIHTPIHTPVHTPMHTPVHTPTRPSSAQAAGQAVWSKAQLGPFMHLLASFWAATTASFWVGQLLGSYHCQLAPPGTPAAS